ncbi:ras and Rab interactor 3 [Syngnathus scovelli]|uniref:ras and Rab interactor 3 n=1 Tax=Syngnathus scovelli TaxID=161590 RepID=UPI0021104389|nr:ras and Rab interactor 3 [Syngnathus scovelli]
MMEASVDSQETGQTPTLTAAAAGAGAAAHNTCPKPCRPRPPAPAVKSSQIPSRPPLPPPTLMCKAAAAAPPVPALPPPLSPTPHTVSPLLLLESSIKAERAPCLAPLPSAPAQAAPAPAPAQAAPASFPSALPSPPDILPVSPTLSLIDLLVGSTSVWLTKGLRQEQISRILREEAAGVFLVQSSEEQCMTLSVRLPDEQEVVPIRDLEVKQHKTFLHLDGSALLFDDIYKLVSFYCVSRDILAAPLKLPQGISMATEKEELEIISAMGADFWTSDMNQKTTKQNLLDPNTVHLYINPITLAETPSKQPKEILIDTPKSIISYLLNGESNQKEKTEVKSTSNQDTKFKRPPPRPPSLGAAGSGSGMGLLFSTEKSSFAAERPGAGDKEDRKTALTSPPPSRPPVPSLRPAPLRRASSGNSPDAGDKGPKGRRREGEKTGAAAQGGGVSNAPGGESQDKEEDKRDILAERPARPVPQPRKKAPSPDNSAAKVGPQRPDVSLYSPQGGAVLGADGDSCSNSSTEEEEGGGGGETNQEQDQNHNKLSENGGSKMTRTPTTVMLGKARSRLSTVITGLISHDRRLSQRIVELARDPLSYFGNLVKDHRAFTLETMSKHSTSTELLQEIRQMMTQLKSYLLQSTELQAMMEPQHQYSQDKLESIVEAALCKSVLKPLKEPVYGSLKKLHTDNGSLQQLAHNQSAVLGSTTTALGVTTAVPEAPAMEKISVKLSNLHLEYSPPKKIELLLKACKIIYDSMSVSSPGRAHGADDFLPVMIYVLARSNLSDLVLDVEYMMELMDPTLTIGEGSYYLTTTYGALEHIKTFDQHKSAPRQLSREIQDSIQRWERRRTLNQECLEQRCVQEFLTVCCPDIGSNPKTFGILPATTVLELTEQCAARFDRDSHILSIYQDGLRRPLAPTDLALSVKNKCQPGAYCFLYHPVDYRSPVQQAWVGRTCPAVPPPRPPQSALQNISDTENSEEDGCLISW